MPNQDRDALIRDYPQLAAVDLNEPRLWLDRDSRPVVIAKSQGQLQAFGFLAPD